MYDDRAVGRRGPCRPLGWVRTFCTAMMSPSGSLSLATHLDPDRHPAPGAGEVGAGDRWAVDLVGRHDADLDERARLVAALVGDRVAEGEAGHDVGVDLDVDGLAVEPRLGITADGFSVTEVTSRAPPSGS